MKVLFCQVAVLDLAATTTVYGKYPDATFG